MRITPIFLVFLVGVYSSVWRLKKNMFDIDYFDEHSSTESTTVAISVDPNYKPLNTSVPEPLYGELSVDAPVKSNRILNDTLVSVYAAESFEDIGDHTNSTQKINSNQSNITIDNSYKSGGCMDLNNTLNQTGLMNVKHYAVTVYPTFLLLVLNVILVIYIIIIRCCTKTKRRMRNRETQTVVAIYTTSLFICPNQNLSSNVLVNENFCEVDLNTP